MITGSESSGSAGAGSFAQLFERQANILGRLVPGEIVPATIVEIGKDYVSLDIGFKTDALCPTPQFQSADGKINGKLGDVVDVFIVNLENEYGQLIVSREKAEQKKVWRQVEDTFKKDGIVRGKIVQKVKGGLQVDIGIPAFLPGSQIDIRPHRHLDKFIEQVFDFKILKITRDKGNIVLSRRALLLSERDKLRSETLKVLAEGVVMEGTVKNVTDYGAFVDLGGIDGLLHITDISWGRVNHPAEKLTVGHKVPVVVLKYDAESERVSLGMKQLKADPWVTVHERYPIGGRVKGKVTNIQDYGVFVELEEGVDGFVHVSELSWTKKVRSPSKVVSTGEMVESGILGIEQEDRRINLSIKQLLPNPWEELSKKLPIGAKIKGKVRSITEFGIFVGVDEGIDGLVHVSDFSWTKRIKDPKEIHEMFRKGEEVEAIILDIDVVNERLSLGIKQLSADPWETISQRYPVGSKVRGKVSSITDFGIFVEIEEGIEGLIHNSQLALERGQNAAEVYPPNSQIECEITNADREERRISLSVKAIQRRKEKEAMAEFMEDTSTAVTFGDLLRQKIDSSDR